MCIPSVWHSHDSVSQNTTSHNPQALAVCKGAHCKHVCSHPTSLQVIGGDYFILKRNPQYITLSPGQYTTRGLSSLTGNKYRWCHADCLEETSFRRSREKEDRVDGAEQYQ